MSDGGDEEKEAEEELGQSSTVSLGEAEHDHDQVMLVDMTQRFANIATQKKQQMMGMALLQQQEKYRDQLVRT